MLLEIPDMGWKTKNHIPTLTLAHIVDGQDSAPVGSWFIPLLFDSLQGFIVANSNQLAQDFCLSTIQ